MTTTRICRALLSTWDKSELGALASALDAAGIELISTGGTRKELEADGLRVTEIGALTGRPEAFGGRMKTLSFEIASALLFERERDADEARTLGIAPIDLVVCNLYPFEEHSARGLPLAELIEYIDIGGPTMIRAAAKNHRYVTVLTDPADYAAVAAEIRAHGQTSAETRARLAAKAFARTAAYDVAIAAHMATLAEQPAVYEARTRSTELRYGENPHQEARVFAPTRVEQALHFDVLGGKELSFNNYLDLQAALDAVVDLPSPAVAVVKHGNPCGLAHADTSGAALVLAWAGDPISAFGSVIASNAPLGLDDVRFFALDATDKSARKFVEIVAGPAFSEEAIEYLRQHKSLRILRVEPGSGRSAEERRWVRGLVLVQDADRTLAERLEIVSKAKPALDEELVRFGLVAVRQVKSNAIVIVGRAPNGACRLLGMGSGQPNRKDSVQLAAARAHEQLQREGAGAHIEQAILVSDAFFPFADGVEIALDAGVRVVVQPGGSLRDAEVIAACDARGATLVHTGTRHFLH